MKISLLHGVHYVQTLPKDYPADQSDDRLDMTFGQLWLEHNTAISLLLGPILTLITFRVTRLKIRWKLLIILVAMFLLTGLAGVLKYSFAILLIIIVLHGAFVSIWGFGILGMAWLSTSQGWHLKWWQWFLICAAWGPVSMLLDLVNGWVIVFAIRTLGVLLDRLPPYLKRRLRAYER